jgi:hypothetical protein
MRDRALARREQWADRDRAPLQDPAPLIACPRSAFGRRVARTPREGRGIGARAVRTFQRTKIAQQHFLWCEIGA